MVIEFLMKNASAIFALAGVLSGALITGAISYLLKTKETRLRLTEKVLDRKLGAHERVIDIANLLRSMVIIGGDDNDGELKRTPMILKNRKNMDDFMAEFMKMQTEADRWLSARVKREISLFIDYFVNVYEHFRYSTDESIQEAGVFVRNDFIDFSLRIENVAHEFFNNDLLKLRFKTDRDWHKYPKEKTFRELDKTEFFKRKDEIISVLRNHK